MPSSPGPFSQNNSKDRINSLAASAQQADADLVRRSGQGSGGIVVHAPDADADTPGVFLRANLAKPTEGV